MTAGNPDQRPGQFDNDVKLDTVVQNVKPPYDDAMKPTDIFDAAPLPDKRTMLERVPTRLRQSRDNA